MGQNNEDRDIVLCPSTYAYLQDGTKGIIKVYVGPCVINQTGQDTPIRFDPTNQNFQRCAKLEAAVVQCPLANEGSYIVLDNPNLNDEFPEEGGGRIAPELRIGKKVNIPGPCNFALWPLQRATVIPGHRLRSYQYLVVRIYNEEEAKKNWGMAITKPASEEKEEKSLLPKQDLTLGQLLVIKGNEISFYIPPTGVEVLADSKGNYVRDAVVLERLEYCILIDENGNKRYEKGPKVVFPEPTEVFYSVVENGQTCYKFRAIELNPVQGLHVKVIESYDDHKVGEELFLTGEICPIYYPRVEHSIVKYGDKEKYYATVIPTGEGRYVMNRTSGAIVTEKGPKMLLADPRNYVIVRRVLSDKQCRLYYPGNIEVLSYNQNLRQVAQKSPSARSGFVSEGDVNMNVQASSLFSFDSTRPMAEPSNAIASESFVRNYQNASKTITLDTRFEGVPSISVWTGYVVMVVNKRGDRKVVEGPQTILLDYDETLETLQLSTGKPKNTDKLEETPFLRTINNKVSDIISLITQDHIDISVKLSYRVNFEGDPIKWFQIENYVKFLCDHCRSVLKGVAQNTTIEEFYQKGVSIVRQSILGEDGMFFPENGMRVVDVEVLDISISNKEIDKLLINSQETVVKSNIQLYQAEKDLEVSRVIERINREKAEEVNLTKKRISELESDLVKIELNTAKCKIDKDKALASEQELLEKLKESIKDVLTNAELARAKAKQDQQLYNDKAKSEIEIGKEQSLTKTIVERFQAMQPGFSEALLQLQSQETLTKIAEALSVQKLAGGKNVLEIVQGLFSGCGVEGLLTKVTDRMKSGSL